MLTTAIRSVTRRALHAGRPLAAAVGSSPGGRADAGPGGALPHARGLDDDRHLHPPPAEPHNPAHDTVLGTILEAAKGGGVPPHAAGGAPSGGRGSGGGASQKGGHSEDDEGGSVLHKAKGKLKKAVGSATEKVAHAFTSTGAVGREFEPEGAVGKTVGAAGGPLAADGAVGKEFGSGGVVGGSIDVAAHEVEEEGAWVAKQGDKEVKDEEKGG